MQLQPEGNYKKRQAEGQCCLQGYATTPFPLLVSQDGANCCFSGKEELLARQICCTICHIAKYNYWTCQRQDKKSMYLVKSFYKGILQDDTCTEEFTALCRRGTVPLLWNQMRLCSERLIMKLQQNSKWGRGKQLGIHRRAK